MSDYSDNDFLGSYFTAPNRYLCEVLDEIVNIYTPLLSGRHKNVLRSLIEEARTHGKRMESALYDQQDIRRYAERKAELKKEIKKLEEKLNTLAGEESDED